MSEQQLLQAGNYGPCKLKEATFGCSSKGTPRWELTFEIEPGINRTIHLYTSDGAIGSTIKTLQMLGATGPGDIDKMQFPQEMWDTGTELYCKHEEYENKMQEKWNISLFQSTPATPDQAQAFKTAWKSHAGAPTPAGKRPDPKPAGNGAPPPKKSSSAPPPKKGESKLENVAKDRDSAWAHGQEKNPNADSDLFYKAIEARETSSKRKEDNFTADDWNVVAHHVALGVEPDGIPF